MDQKDLYTFFLNLKEKYQENYIYSLFENYEINKLDINRFFRFLDKYTLENAIGISEKNIIEEESFEDESPEEIFD
jgi:hypothetical protein